MRVLILLALLGLAAAVPKNQQRIVGGTPTTVENYPFMSNMQYLWWGIWWMQSCGGSLITTTSVLSAAHCFEGDRASEWRVRLGTSQASSGGSVHDVTQLVLHQGYSGATLDHDVAIVRLASPAVYSNSIAAVSVAGPNYNLADNTLVTTIGWGALSSGGGAPEQLQHVDIYTINWQFCADRYAYLKTLPGYSRWPDLTENMLCAGIQHIGGKDACQGDSGGPLVHQSGGAHVLVGIVSWGFECAHPDYPGVNAAVNKHTDWIVSNA